jgi:CcmD family protein
MAQETQKTEPLTPVAPERPANAPGILYQVAGVILVIWLGLALFLFRIDRKVAKLERSLYKAGEGKSE